MRKGYRPNVGIIIANTKGKLLYCKRRRSNNWQFPQGGIDRNETPEQAAFRELFEEVGIKKHNVKIIAESQHWYQYDLPKKFQLNKLLWNNFKGQSQKWFIFKFLGNNSEINIPEKVCREMAKEAMKQERLLVNNPRTITLADAEKIYKAAW